RHGSPSDNDQATASPQVHRSVTGPLYRLARRRLSAVAGGQVCHRRGRQRCRRVLSPGRPSARSGRAARTGALERTRGTYPDLCPETDAALGVRLISRAPVRSPRCSITFPSQSRCSAAVLLARSRTLSGTTVILSVLCNLI